MTGVFPEIIDRLLSRTPLPSDSVRAAFDDIFAGRWTPVQVAAFIVALRMRGENAETVVSAAKAIRAAMTPVQHSFSLVVDTCGTGGDGAHTLNLSSGAALVVAACGLRVAKHGNRSVSSKCGSADVFEALGIPIDLPAALQGQILDEAGIAFLFAQTHHPAYRHVAQARRELGMRTIFNALGPLVNPARPTHQLVGVYDDGLRPLAARALGLLGSKGAWVVCGEDGLDEVSPCSATRVSELTPDGEVRERVVAPEDFGLQRCDRASIAGGSAQENARSLQAIIAGEPHPARDAVLLNAAAAIAVATGDDLRSCAERARLALDRGHARDTLDRWRRAARRAQATP
ncbi:MAG TPA: anthranilate phosphoribosyltransferase [Polyangiaceae bacterium]|nr:anthranilate phosphoribosyltransferase [Polyangiaceae bacterium]